ncbi:hypothetical protein ACE5KN_28370 [Paenibacillus terreus]
MKIYRKMMYSLGLLTMALTTVPKHAHASGGGGSLPSGLGGFQSISDDAYNFAMWVIWVLGPILFLIALTQYMKSNDPGDKKQAKQWMYAIAIATIAAQIVVWFLHEYLAPKF